jgi:hypothetical protein
MPDIREMTDVRELDPVELAGVLGGDSSRYGICGPGEPVPWDTAPGSPVPWCTALGAVSAVNRVLPGLAA